MLGKNNFPDPNLHSLTFLWPVLMSRVTLSPAGDALSVKTLISHQCRGRIDIWLHATQVICPKAHSNFREMEINCLKNCNSKLPSIGDNLNRKFLPGHWFTQFDWYASWFTQFDWYASSKLSVQEFILLCVKTLLFNVLITRDKKWTRHNGFHMTFSGLWKFGNLRVFSNGQNVY